MKKIALTFLALLSAIFAWAEYTMLFHKVSGKTSTSNCEQVDSVKCQKNGLAIYQTGSDVSEILFTKLDSITFIDADELIPRDTVFITYSENSVKCINPYEELVSISTKDACVDVVSHAYHKDIVYVLSGSSSNGHFSIDSERKFKVILNGLNLTSKSELPPIRSFSGKTVSVILNGKNVLTDSASDTCNAVFRSKGQIVFEDSQGSLELNAKQKRAIQSGDYILVNGGTIKTSSSVGDCVRANDYFVMTGGDLSMDGGGLNVTNGYFQMDGGSISVSSSLDEVKAFDIESELVDEEGDTISDSQHGAFFMNGGKITFDISGKGGRLVKTDGDVTVKNGAITGSMSGPSVYISDDGVTNTSIIKAKGIAKFLGGNHVLSVSSAATGGRVLTGDNGLFFDGGVKMTLSNSSSSYSYVTYMNAEKKKVSSVLKSDNDIVFDSCDVKIVSDAASDGAYGIITDNNNNVEVNESAVVVVECVSNDGVFMDEKTTGRLISYGGFISSYSVKGLAFACPVSSCGGVFLGVGAYRHNGGFRNSSYGTFVDVSYDQSSIQITDVDGNVKFSHNGLSKNATENTNKMCFGFPLVKGDTYIYKYGGTLSGKTIGCSDFVEDGVYSGGEEVEVVAPKANSFFSITK